MPNGKKRKKKLSIELNTKFIKEQIETISKYTGKVQTKITFSPKLAKSIFM